MIGDQNAVTKALVTLALEKTLIGFGKPVYDKVLTDLNSDGHYLTDCYEHPEYISKVLTKIFGKSSIVIIESITKELEEYVYHTPIKKFLEVICV